MASEMRVNTLKDAGGNNSIATSFVAGGSAKAWANINAGTGRDTFNLSGVVDDGTGLYSVDFTSNMSDGNYAAPGCATFFGNDSATGLVYAMRTSSNVYTEHASNGFALRISDNNTDSALDSGSVELTVMGDLA